jgi:chloride channel protein, CIC family
MTGKVYSQVRKPIRYLRNHLSEKNFFILSAILVGLTSGLAAVMLKYVVHSIERFMRYSSRNFEEFLVFAPFPIIGIVLTVLYQRYVLKAKVKRGSSEIAYAILKKSSVVPPSEMYSHLITSGLTVGFGGSVGLESPMVSTGAAIGSNFASTYDLSYKDKTILLACGAAAGIAAAFNAPIAGVLFAIEVLLADVTAAAFIPLIISAATGALVSKVILREGVILTFSLQEPFDYHNVPFYVILGLLSGVVALYYIRTTSLIEHNVTKISNWWARPLFGGAVLFLLILLFPPLFGEGYETIKALAGTNTITLKDSSLLGGLITNESTFLLFLGALIFLKAIATAVTLGSGGNGGSFGPSLFVGAYLGYVFARVLNLTKAAVIPESNFTLVAMAGILSGVFFAPLTAIFLIAELTGGYDLMIPLMIVSSLSLVVVHLFEPLSPEAKKLSEKLQVSVETRDKLLLSRIDLSALIESNFSVVHPNDSLGTLIKVIANSTRNIFPVVDNDKKLKGLIHLDRIRQVIFDSSKYDSILVSQLMADPLATIHVSENMHQALQKFDTTSQWNLPVVDDGMYVGFLSKSTILTRYRNELLESA